MDRSDNSPAESDRRARRHPPVNRFLARLEHHRRCRAAVSPRPPRRRDPAVLDVGTGGADIPIDLVREARRLNRRASASSPSTATRSRSTTLAGKRPQRREIEIIAADAFDLPFAADVVRSRDRLDVPPPLRPRRRRAPAGRSSGDRARARCSSTTWSATSSPGRSSRCRPHHEAPPYVRARCGAFGPARLHQAASCSPLARRAGSLDATVANGSPTGSS